MSRIRRSASTVVLLAALAVGGLTDLRSSATAMACCARARGQCAGVKSADDCCARMTHASPTVAAVLGASPTPPPPPIVATPLSAADAARIVRGARVVFKRPHDPPHLHAAALLI